MVYSYSHYLTLPSLERTPGLWSLLCFYRKALCTTKCVVGWNNKRTRHSSVWIHSEKKAHLYSNYSSNLILCLHQHLHRVPMTSYKSYKVAGASQPPISLITTSEQCFFLQSVYNLNYACSETGSTPHHIYSASIISVN